MGRLGGWGGGVEGWAGVWEKSESKNYIPSGNLYENEFQNPQIFR
jgi:hypothetical protein